MAVEYVKGVDGHVGGVVLCRAVRDELNWPNGNQRCLWEKHDSVPLLQQSRPLLVGFGRLSR